MQMSSFGEKKALLLMEEEEYSNIFVQRNARQLARKIASQSLHALQRPLWCMQARTRTV